MTDSASDRRTTILSLYYVDEETSVAQSESGGRSHFVIHNFSSLALETYNIIFFVFYYFS